MNGRRKYFVGFIASEETQKPRRTKDGKKSSEPMTRQQMNEIMQFRGFIVLEATQKTDN